MSSAAIEMADDAEVGSNISDPDVDLKDYISEPFFDNISSPVSLSPYPVDTTCPSKTDDAHRQLDDSSSSSSSPASLTDDEENDEEDYSSLITGTNFRLCSIVTVPIGSSQARKLSLSSSSPHLDERRRKKAKNRPIKQRNFKLQKAQSTPDYHRISLATKPGGGSSNRKFDQAPPTPIAVLYTSLSDLLSPRPSMIALAEKSASSKHASTSDDPSSLPGDNNNFKYRVIAPIQESSLPTMIEALTPKMSIKRRSKHQKTPDSAVSSSFSDMETGSLIYSSSDDDCVVKITPPDANSIEVEQSSAMKRRNRELMLHSGLRRHFERLMSPQPPSSSFISPDSAIRLSLDATNEGLNSLLKVRQLQASPTMPTLHSLTAQTSSLLASSRAQTPVNNNVLAQSIRETFIKHFGPPPTTIISTGSAKVRDSIFTSPPSVPEQNHSQTTPSRPVTHQGSRPSTKLQNHARPKSVIMGHSSSSVLPSRHLPYRQAGTNNDQNHNNSSLASYQTPYSRGRSRFSANINTPSDAGDDMAEADPSDGRRPAATRAPRVSVTSSQVPSYYIGGHNGSALVEAPLLALGWKRITEKTSDQFRFKWCDIKASINYSSFREGEQIVNHIPNSQLLTNKLGLLNSLQDYDRQLTQNKRRGMRLNQFYPETYRLDDRGDRDAFLQTYKDGEIWICKPTGLNQGIGIHLVRTLEEARALADDRENRMAQARGQVRQPMTRIVQRYILRPLLLEGRKFDIRCYMLIASTSPWLVLYHKGYIRLSIHTYHPDSPNLTVHLTNQYIQKKDSAYKDVKENTAWSMDQFNAYINENVMEAKGIERDWVFNTMTKQIQRIIVHMFSAVKNKMASKVGYFELYGLDFMIDDNMKVILIEVNTNPSLSTNVGPLAEVIPGVVYESVNLAIECFDKSRKGQPLMPLKSLNGFNVVFHGNRKTIDMGPGDTQAEAEDPNDVPTWPKLAIRTNAILDSTLKRALTARPAGPVFESKVVQQKFQQQIINRGPAFNSAPSSARVPLKYSTNGNLLGKSKSAVREFYPLVPSTSDEDSGVTTENLNANNPIGFQQRPGIRLLSSSTWEKSQQTSNQTSKSFKAYNWPSRDPAVTQQMKRRQDVKSAVWNSNSSLVSPSSARWVKTAGATRRSSDDEEETEAYALFPVRSELDLMIKRNEPLFKAFRVVFVEESNSPPPDRQASVRRTRSLSPVKVNNPVSPNPRPANPNSPKQSPGPPVITPRPRTVRQTLSTSVATVRVSNNNGTVSDVTDDPAAAAANQATAGNPVGFPQSAAQLQSASLQRQVTFAPMTLPTVRLQLTQVQFPYPVIAGQTIASVPASALATGGGVSSLANSPYLNSTGRVKTKERKDRGN